MTKSVQETYERLKRLVATSESERLPPERKLSEKMDISRNTLREAIRILEFEGILSTKMGSGTYILKRTEIDLKLDFQLQIRLDIDYLIELLEIRRGLEGIAIKGTVENLDERSLHRLDSLYRKLEPWVESGGEVPSADRDFHEELYRLSKRRIAPQLYRNLESALSIFWDHKSIDLSNLGSQTGLYHRELFDAIRTGDETSALVAHNRIIDSVIDELLIIKSKEIKGIAISE